MTAPVSQLVSPRDLVSSGLCTGCGACVAAKDGGKGLRWDKDGLLRPFGPAGWYEGRAQAFSRICPFSPLAANESEIAAARFPIAPWGDGWVGRFEAAYVGHAAEPGFRERGSSGGMVSWVAAELLRRGLVDGVAHVAATDPGDGEDFFGYRMSRTVDEVCARTKSCYYPVEMSAVLAEMREVPGRYAIVGIPCFIKAVHLLCATDPVLCDRVVFTLGLVCGHMKSRHMVESFSWQMGLSLKDVERIEFRLKNPDRPANWYTAQLACHDGETRSRDWWHLVDGDWGSGFFQNPACDFCDDVVAETADISFGDAWIEPYSSDGRGTNIVVVRSPGLHALLAEAIGEGRLDLTPVDAAFVKETQAAAFRQRREGLAYRLRWRRKGVHPVKRVFPTGERPTLRRRLVYRCRHHISRWSVRVFRLAKWLGRPGLFLAWGRSVLFVYHGFAYSRGWIGQTVDWAERALSRPDKTSQDALLPP
ncbi:MAG TPA: Coenzyme F420 hydrogenase/dehydrogenase, beta subunit C-terminal domain [Sphingobium sp.]|nr:Coenzyme F420 hydrogenase/dehydrogenase, beta subunit C-terminal domain [Sphingobium sp.]